MMISYVSEPFLERFRESMSLGQNKIQKKSPKKMKIEKKREKRKEIE